MIDFIKQVDNAINLTEDGITRLPKFILEMNGMSNKKVRALLNEICNFEGCNYCEVGSYLGSSFCSAIYNNPGNFCSIDYWPNKEEFDKTRTEFKTNLGTTLSLQKSLLNGQIKLIDEDCFKYDKKDLKDINVYLYDGDHSRESQRNGILYYFDNLAKEFILIVDDYNDKEAYTGTIEAFNALNGHVQIKKYWQLPGLVRDWSVQDDISYWNGLGVFVCEKI